MRILMVTDFYHPLLGGVEQHVRTLSQELARLGHDVAVATLRTGDSAERERDGDVEVYRIGSGTQRLPRLFDQARPWAPPIPDPVARRSLRRVIDDFRPDVVHGHDWLARSLLPLGKGHPPLITSLHYYTLSCAKKNLLFRGAPCSGPEPRKCLGCAMNHYGRAKGAITAGATAVGRRLEQRATERFIAVSTATAEGNGLDPRECDIIPNFLPTTDVDEQTDIDVDSYLNQLPTEPFFAYVGDFRATKGFSVLLDAYEGLDTDRPLVVIGKRWPTTPEHFPAGVIAFEKWPNAAVRAMYRRARAGIVPSVWAEPFGIVAIEAMEQGAPVIAAASGGLVDIVADRRTGLLVEPDSVESLRTAMAEIDGNDLLAAELGAAAQVESQRYRADRVVPDIVAIYQSAIGEQRRG